MLTVAGAGIDTWSPCWYVEEGAAREAIAARMAAGLLVEPVLGHRVGWTRGLLWAEGHPGDLLGLEGRLAPGDGLPEALRVITEGLWAQGVPVPEGVCGDDAFGWELFGVEGTFRRGGFAGVRRCDATADLRFERREDGLAVLAGVAALFSEMRGQADVRFAKGARGIETAYLRGHGGSRILGRWYDKGVQTGQASRGVWLRAEDQRRYTKETRRDVAELTTAYVRGNWQRRWMPLWRASQGVTVASPVGLADKLYEAAAAGEISARQCESLCGYLLLSSRREGSRIVLDTGKLERDRGLSRATVMRRRAELRELGLVLADGLTVLEEVEVDLHQVLEQALEEGPWGVG